MAAKRDRPFAQFNFLVDLGTGNSDGPEAGFQECSNIGMEVAVAEYRNGNEKENSVRKVTGLNKATDVTLKRGVIGSDNLYAWLNDIRNGDAERAADGHDPADQRGPHRPRSRPGSSCARGSSSTSPARSTPRARTWRWRSSRSRTSAWRWRSRGR